MKHKWFAVVCLFSFAFSLSAPAQMAFFQPPTFSGAGTTFLGDFNGDGKPDILTADGTVSLGNGDGTFRQGTTATGTVLAVADVNGDAKADIVEQGTGTLLVLLGKGDGTFQPAISTTSGASLTNITAVDLNGDGKADVIGFFNDALLVYISKGDGTFSAPASYTLGAGMSPSPIFTLGDFNGDNKIDVAVTVTYNFAVGQEFVFPGNGDGTFQAAIMSSGLGVIQYATAIAAGDFNSDGKLDLAISTTTQCHGICTGTGYVLLGNGNGTFQAPTVSFFSMGPLAAADVNGDGKLDLITEPDPNTTVAAIYLGNGDGTFSLGNSYVSGLGSKPYGGTSGFSDGIVIADFDGDGKFDIAADGSILLANGGGSFKGIPYSQGTSFPLATGDFDNNGTVDVASASSSVSILSNDGNGVLAQVHTYSLPFNFLALGIASADLNGDGHLDLIVDETAGGTWAYSVLLGNGDGSFQSPVDYPQSTAAGSFPLVLADFNKDHKLDFAVPAGTNTLAVFLGNGDGTFAAPVYYFDGGGGPLLVGDFNSDGNLDIIVAGNQSGFQTATLFGNGDGTFAAAVFPTGLSGFFPMFTADVNNDGKADLVSANQVALGNGDGTFTFLPVISPGNGGSYTVSKVADMNSDGKPDLIVTLLDQNTAVVDTGVLLGIGDGTFSLLIPVPSNGVAPWWIEVADMNGDQMPDILFSWPPPGSVTAQRGIGELFSLGLQAPDYTVGPAPGTPTSQTVSPGQTANFTLALTPSSSFNGTVTLSCAITPLVSPAPSCALSNSSVQLTGSAAQQITVTVGTTALSAASIMPTNWPPVSGAFIGVALGLMCLSAWGHRMKPALAGTVALGFILLTGCGGGASSSQPNPTPPTPSGTYTATVTATSGALSHSMNFQVVVQ